MAIVAGERPARSSASRYARALAGERVGPGVGPDEGAEGAVDAGVRLAGLRRGLVGGDRRGADGERVDDVENIYVLLPFARNQVNHRSDVERRLGHVPEGFPGHDRERFGRRL